MRSGAAFAAGLSYLLLSVTGLAIATLIILAAVLGDGSSTEDFAMYMVVAFVAVPGAFLAVRPLRASLLFFRKSPRAATYHERSGSCFGVSIVLFLFGCLAFLKGMINEGWGRGINHVLVILAICVFTLVLSAMSHFLGERALGS